MKHLFAAAALLAPVAALADTLEASSKVTRATVYADGAAVQRQATVSIPAGEHTVVLRGLPAGLDAASLRVDGRGNAALAIVSVDSRVAPGDPRPTVDPDRERRLDALKGERDSLAGAIEAADGQKAAILRYAQASPEKLSTDSAPLDPERWPQAWRAIGSGLAEINEALRGLREKARLLDADIAALERAYPPSPRPGAPKRDVLIAVAGSAPVAADITVSYQIAAAAWTPVYDAKLATGGDKPKLDLTRRATVQQRTGEDWTGVSLALSTLRLRRGTAAPDLPTQTLALVDPFTEAEAARAGTLARPVPAAPAAKMATEARRFDAPAAQPAIPAAPVLATLDAGAYEAAYGIPGTVDIPADGTLKSFALGTRAVEPNVGARTTPALDPTAYLEASFTNDEDAPLLPGEVVLVRDGVFVGKGRLGLVAPGDKVRLGFGADDRVKVTRNPVTRKDNDNNFFGTNRGETQDFRTTVKNLHAFPMRVTLVDRLPVSENTAIVVTPLDTNTPPTEKVIDGKRGVSAWTYDYKPGEQKEVRLGWRVRWPADRELLRQ